ncbi:MAG TPA: hypothetical protein VJI96_03490 [Candidatus Andersenbacteria bacterium]|nr:hypothetical protein [Candidatus Andersenbacteria bacterium]
MSENNSKQKGLPREAPPVGGSKWGFSLVESLVVVAIISTLTVLGLTAIPGLRSHQELVTDTENFRAMLLDSKQRTINQVRPADCLPGLAVDDPARAACSDVGVAFAYGELIQYANTANQDQYTYETGVSGDYEISRKNIVSTVLDGSAISFLFISAPPTVKTYADGGLLGVANDAAPITLIATDGSTRTVTVHSLGTIDIGDSSNSSSSSSSSENSNSGNSGKNK